MFHRLEGAVTTGIRVGEILIGVLAHPIAHIALNFLVDEHGDHRVAFGAIERLHEVPEAAGIEVV